MAIPLKVLETVFSAAAVTTTTTLKSLNTEFMKCCSLYITVETTGFSGTIDVQGKVPGGTYKNLNYIELDVASSSNAVAQLSYTLETANKRYLIPNAPGDVQIVITRSAGSVSVFAEGSGEPIPSPFGSASTSTLTERGFVEDWTTGVIDAAIWTAANPATGDAWAVTAVTDLFASSIPNANETTRLHLTGLFLHTDPTGWGLNSISRRLVVEWEMDLGNVANLDNTLSFFGLFGNAQNRSSNDIIGFGLASDVLQSVTDASGTETTTTTFGETLTNWNKLKIVVEASAVKFYVNEVLKATHTTNLPTQITRLCFFGDTEVGGAATIKIGGVRVWYEDEA